MITILTFLKDNYMARKSKFIDKVCFIHSDDWHNKPGKSAYVFITHLETKSNYMTINGIDIYGKTFYTRQGKNWPYQNLEILDLQHINHDFITGLFDK